MANTILEFLSTCLSQRPPMLAPFDLPQGILLLITDELAAPADFLLHRSLISHIKEINGPTKTIVLSVSEDLARWKAVASKLVRIHPFSSDVFCMTLLSE